MRSGLHPLHHAGLFRRNGWIACSSNYFIPASGQCVAAIAFDTAGTTKIGKYVLNHSYMLPGLVCTVVSVVSAILIGAVVF